MKPFDTRYLQLTLEINKHIDGYIDAYTGPAALQAEVQAAPKKEVAVLLDELAWLQDHLPTTDPARRAYLTAVLRALACTLHLLRGDEIPYLEEVSRIYDVTPAPADETLFAASHRELDTLLPGAGTIAERLEARRKQYYLPREKVLPLLELARDEAKKRTMAFVDLPHDNGVEVTLTQNQPWGAYNWFKGNGRSHIEFNTDTPISALGLLSTFAHEGYPGHHTEHLLKEKKFWQERGYGEMAAALLHSPSAVIAEGIATTAVEIIFPDNTDYEWTISVLLPAAGLETEETAADMRRISQAANQLKYVGGNAAILYHTGQLNKEETIEYIRTHGLRSRQRAEKGFSFLAHPLFRSYIFTYTQGYDLIAAAAGNGEKRPLFARLLTEQILPSQIK